MQDTHGSHQSTGVRKSATQARVANSSPQRHWHCVQGLTLWALQFSAYTSGVTLSVIFCCCIQRRLFTPEYILVSFLPTLVQEKGDIFSFYSVSVLFSSRLSSSLETSRETFQCVKKGVEVFKASPGVPVRS